MNNGVIVKLVSVLFKIKVVIKSLVVGIILNEV